VIGKIEAVLNSAREAQVDAFKKVIDPTDEASPLGRYNAQLTKVVKDEVSSLRTAVNEVSEKIAVRSAEAELLEKTTIKGASFEELVHGVVSGLAAAHGDIAEETGGKSGATGGKVGDEVVTINTEDTRGAAARYTLECKDRKRGLDGILDELDEALKNREACAAIAVFSCEAYSPCATPFAYFGNRAIVVLDKNEPDDRALRLALMWARWVTRRQLAEASETVDVDQIERIVGDASRALDRVATIRRCHSSARNKIDEAGKQVTDLAGDVENALERVREELRA
jgi:hypothetical protein